MSVSVKIFKLHLDHPDKYRGTFLLGDRKDTLKHVVSENYTKVYECKRKDEYTTEDAFHEFNCQHPADYTASSLSVSDVVSIDNDYWFCDSLGWKRVKPFPEMEICTEQ